MHADERQTHIQPRVGFDALHQHGVLHAPIGGRGQRAAGLGAGNGADDLQTVLFRGAALHHQRAVQMLAALEGAFEAAGFGQRQRGLCQCLAQFVGGLMADGSSGHLAAGAADGQQSDGIEKRAVEIDQLGQCGGGRVEDSLLKFSHGSFLRA